MISPAPKPKTLRCEDYREAVRGLPCVLCHEPGRPHHVRAKGAGGGDSMNLVPLCTRCHREGHATGWLTWQKKHNLNLHAMAVMLWHAWQAWR